MHPQAVIKEWKFTETGSVYRIVCLLLKAGKSSISWYFEKYLQIMDN